MKKKIEPELEVALNANRLLIISPFKEETIRVSQQNAQKRNEVMLGLADEVVIGHASEGGNLQDLLLKTVKKISYI